MPIAAPTAARIPAADTSKVVEAPFCLEVLVEAAPLLVPVPEPEAPEALLVGAVGSSVGVADVAGYVAPKALTSKGCETAYTCRAR
jgi:hypothetical protein